MNYSPLAEAFAQAGDGVVFDLDSLYSRLADLTARRHQRGRRDALARVLRMTLRSG
jgi:hypothetical protein